MMNYNVGNCSLVIGLIDNQSEMSSEELFKKEFANNIFKGYKKGLGTRGGPINPELYDPKGYHLFGDCNIAVLSLIDDFAFPNRVLHTGHGYRVDMPKECKYTLQLINGIHTQAEGTPVFSTLEEKARATFLKPDGRFPFIGITHYKINNGLLIGNGAELLEMIKLTLYRLKQQHAGRHPVELLCIDSFSNNELVVVYFARKLSDISYFTNETRRLKLRELAAGADSAAARITDGIITGSLLYKCLADTLKNKETLSRQVGDSHVFSTTFSHLGYDMDTACLDSSQTGQEKLNFQFHWDLKPGHYTDFKKIIFEEKKIFAPQTDEERLMPGVDMMQLTVRDITLAEYREKCKQLKECKSIKKYVRKQRANVVFKQHEAAGTSTDTNRHPELVKQLGKCAFRYDKLSQLREDLNTYRVSKVLKERTLKMYGAFNDCITDPLFFNYFIELKEYLQGIFDRVSEYKKQAGQDTPLEELHFWLNHMIRNFEQAYYNRFHHSSRMRNISDFNLEYNGGIQQLISAYDTAYKTILKVFVPQEADRNCVYVSGYERVSSDRDSLRINNFHITYPELYAATVWKEAMNFYWTDPPETSPENLRRSNIAKSTELLFKPECIMMLKNKISNHPDYDPSSYVHQRMYASLNEHFIHYLLADTAVFNIGYLGDFDLFTFWYWDYFSQMSHFYTHEGEMTSDSFIKFLVRWLFIKSFHLQEDLHDTAENYVAFDPKLSELWHCYIKDAISYTRLIINELVNLDFMRYAGSMASLITYRHVESQETEDYVRQQSDELLIQEEAFRKGRMIMLDHHYSSHFSFIRNLMYSYLNAVKELSWAGGKQVCILERDAQGQAIQRDQYRSILADPLGGMFLCSNKERGDYFKLRCVFYKSLWEASLKIKKEYVFSYLKEEEDKKEEK